MLIPILAGVVLVGMLFAVTRVKAQAAPASKLLDQIEKDLPKHLNARLPSDVHSVVTITRQNSVKVTCVGPRSASELYALEQSVMVHVDQFVKTLTESTSVKLRVKRIQFIRDHDDAS